MSNYREATFFAQVDPVWSTYRNVSGERALRGARVTGITQKRPSRPRGGTVVIKLTVRVPDAVFLPLRPEAVIVVPENMTDTRPISIVVENPNEITEE